MKPTRLDRAATVVLDGILRELPALSCDQLDALLARVSVLHRRRRQKAAEEEVARRVADLADRMYSRAVVIPDPDATPKRAVIAARDAEIRRRKAAGERAEDLARRFGVSAQRIYQIVGPAKKGQAA